MSITERRVDKAFDLIAAANTVSILSLDEMQAVILRALRGEFDVDDAQPTLEEHRKRLGLTGKAG